MGNRDLERDDYELRDALRQISGSDFRAGYSGEEFPELFAWQDLQLRSGRSSRLRRFAAALRDASEHFGFDSPIYPFHGQ